jgi:hypothetical protein
MEEEINLLARHSNREQLRILALNAGQSERIFTGGKHDVVPSSWMCELKFSGHVFVGADGRRSQADSQ